LGASGARSREVPQYSSPPEKSQKLPRPQQLGKGAALERDPISSELHSAANDKSAAPADGAIRSRVTMVQVPCTVTAPDGTQVRGLAKDNFRLFENGVPQEIASLDDSATPASIALVLDVSPSIYRELGEMRGAAHSLAANLSLTDQIAVVSFSADAHLLLPFSTNRELLDRALQSKNLARVENSSESKIYQALFYTARDLFQTRPGRKAVVLLTDGEDSGLGLSWDPSSMQPRSGNAELAFDDVARELGADGIALFIVSTENRPRAMTEQWLASRQGAMLITPEARKLGMPNYTLYLAELARRVGGQMFFLREIGDLSEIYRRIAMAISAQYTLGFYPSAGTAQPGWRSLRVEMVAAGSDAKAPPGSKLTHRSSYYVSAFQ
jgi:Ca-activated chloride channel family protein